jgi:hypothetical protein
VGTKSAGKEFAPARDRVAFLATVSRFLATETAPSRVVRLDRAANRWPALSP